MDESSSSRNRFLAIILISLTIAGAWYVIRLPRSHAAVDNTVDAFIPDPNQFQRNLDAIGQARQVTDLINARQTFPDPSPE